MASDHDHDDETYRESKRVTQKRPLLYLAEFETPGKVMKAAEKVRDAGTSAPGS